MAPPLPSNPCLVAIALVINTKGGPRFVYHYPAHPRDDLLPRHSIWNAYADTLDDSDSTNESRYWSSDDEADNEHDAGRPKAKTYNSGRGRGGPDDEDDSSSDEKQKREDQTAGAPWETVFGFPTNNGLEKILSPPRSFHKKKFELELEPLTYLGCPIFVREDGYWRKKKRNKHGTSADQGDDLGERRGSKDAASGDALRFSMHSEHSGHADTGDDQHVPDTIEEMKRKASPDGSHVPSLSQDHTNGAGAEEEEAKSTASDEDRRTMSMFNVVFVVHPPLLEHNLRIKEMFEYVVKKFVKALKYEQARSNWVWRQSEMILNMKERARDQNTSMATLWHQILSKSGLAKALSEVYLSISRSKIAHVFINEAFDVSLQIPQTPSIAELPTAIEPQMPGVWLTTANSVEVDDSLDGFTLAKHFALLLLDDVENILKDIDHEHSPKEVSHPLAEFVQIVKPTMSFLQMSQTHNISLRRIQFLSRHLIYWRRARAIPPLHRGFIYIVSPNADMRSLASATQAYASCFPSLPSLPKMLSMLSGHPRPYSAIIPSKDHRDAYIDILAWLLKGGWVTQLRTFAYVRVPREIKVAVRQKIRREEEQQRQQEETLLDHSDEDKSSISSRSRSSSDVSLRRNTNSSHIEEGGDAAAKPKTDYPTSEGPTGDEEDDDEEEVTILLEPHKANNLESRWLDEIGQSLFSGHVDSHDTDDNDERERRHLKEAWTCFNKYFNGQNALEKLPVREEKFLEGLALHLPGATSKTRGLHAQGANTGRRDGRGVQSKVPSGNEQHGETITDEDADGTGGAGPDQAAKAEGNIDNAQDTKEDMDFHGDTDARALAVKKFKPREKPNANTKLSSTATANSNSNCNSAANAHSDANANAKAIPKTKTKRKRKDVWRWIQEMDRRGYLVVVRHW